jgi:hypothetical protein
MFAISTTADGLCIGAPDICLTPPQGIPVGYVNMAFCRNAVRTSATMRVQNKPVLTDGSFIPMSTGDEPGAMGGITSGTFISICRFVTASAKVYADNQKVILHTSMTSQNNGNCVGQQTTPSQGVAFAAG